MRQGSYVEIRYVGRGAGRVEKGTVKAMHSDGDVDIEMEYPAVGIKFSVPGKIVHEVQVTEQVQSCLDALLPVEGRRDGEMERIKVFTAHSDVDLQEQVNRWLQEHYLVKVLDRQFSTSTETSEEYDIPMVTRYSYCLTYINL